MTAISNPLKIGRGQDDEAASQVSNDAGHAESNGIVHRGEWQQVDRLLPEEGTTLFGGSVALDAEWLLIGATGKALLYKSTGGRWERRREFTRGEDSFGGDIALSDQGSVAAIGQPHSSDASGRVYTTERSNGSWRRLQPLTPDGSTAKDGFGSLIDFSADGDHLIVGGGGTAHIFTNRDDGWVETGSFTPEIETVRAFDSVALDASGTTAVVGTAFAGDNARRGGGASIFERSADGWTHQFSTSKNIEEHYFYGWAVTLNDAGTKAVIGSPVLNPKTEPGFLGVIEQTDEGWEETRRLRRPDERLVGNLGMSLALTPDGRTVAAGDPRDSVDDVVHGSVSVFSMVADQWGNLSKLLPANGKEREIFGSDVSINDTATTTVVSAVGRVTKPQTTGVVLVFERSLCTPSRSSSDRPGVVDDFEDGNREEYVSLGGPLKDWTVQSAHSLVGQYALQYTGGADPSDISSLQGLPQYPARGDVFRFYFQPLGDWDFYTSFNFGQQPDSGFSNRYELEIDPADDAVRLQLDRPGTYQDEQLGQTSVDFSRSATYRVEIDWQARSPDLIITVQEQGSEDPLGRIVTTPPQDAPESGGVGMFGHGEGDRWVYDDIRIVN
jgi:hypothetical protein